MASGNESNNERTTSEQHTRSYDIESIDLKALKKILKRTQCPLIPKHYETETQQVSAYYFNNNLWTIDENNPSKVRMLNCQSNEKKVKAIDTAELMLAIDKYVDNVRINKSHEIYNKLRRVSITDDYDNPYEKLMPTLLSKIMFLSVFLTLMLNGYFTFRGLYNAIINDFGFKLLVMKILGIIVYGVEALLYLDLGIKGLLYNLITLIIKKWNGYSVYIETKTIAFEARDLTSLSILRYLPSVEMVSTSMTNYKESVTKLWVGLKLKKEEKYWFFIFFEILIYLVEIVSPFMAIIALYIKVHALGFVVLKYVGEWDYNNYLFFIAFINQVSGIRVIKDIQVESLQHFVFSGSDASFSEHELLLQSKWWDSTMVNAVSNLNFSTYELIIFWYQLDPLKIQLLLKNHTNDEDAWKRYKKTDEYLYEYDSMVMSELSKCDV